MMARQFTATVYIIDNARTLLIFHKKLQKWMPPGGHIDPNESPAEAAKREAYEETGLHIEFLLQENVWINRWNAKSFERPYMCMIEEVPGYLDTPPHQHIDFIYVARPLSYDEMPNYQETEGMRWFTLKEIAELKSDEEIFLEVQEGLYSIFHSFSNHSGALCPV